MVALLSKVIRMMRTHVVSGSPSLSHLTRRPPDLTLYFSLI